MVAVLLFIIFLPLCPGIFTITPNGPRVFSTVCPCVTSDISDTADWTSKALGGTMHFIIACWDLQKPVAIIGEGFETFSYHMHALSQQLPSNSYALLFFFLRRATQSSKLEDLSLWLQSDAPLVAVSVKCSIQGHRSIADWPFWSGVCLLVLRLVTHIDITARAGIAQLISVRSPAGHVPLAPAL